MSIRPAMYLASLAVFATAMLITAATYPENPEKEIRVAIASLEALASANCPLNCEFDCAYEGDHITIENSGGNDGGELHNCTWSQGSCKDHSCTLTQLDDVEVLQETLPLLDVPQLRGLHATRANLLLNTQRRAIQVLSCDKVVLSVPMTSEQIAGLVSD